MNKSLLVGVLLFAFLLVLSNYYNTKATYFKSQKRNGSYLHRHNEIMVVVSIGIICMIAMIIGIQLFGKVDPFIHDVMNTYLRNIYGTGRFSAMPLVDVCVMYFVYLHVVCFLLLRRKLIENDILMISINATAVIYILLIGIFYVIKWAGENIVANGEYLTGFERYMIIPVAMIYCFWIYMIILLIYKRHRETTGKSVNSQVENGSGKRE